MQHHFCTFIILGTHTDKLMKSDIIRLLKGFSILGIIIVHSPQFLDLSNVFLRQLLNVGRFGCQLLFLISGYLMMCSWNRIEKNKTIVFYKKRIVSIAPLYLCAILFYQVFSFIFLYTIGDFFMSVSHDPLGILLNSLLLGGLYPKDFYNYVPGGWYIGTICLFYFLFPILYRILEYIKKINIKLIFFLPLFATLLSFIIQFVIFRIDGTWQYSKNGGFIYYSITNQLCCMLLGMVAFYIDKPPKKCVFKFISYFFLGCVLFYFFKQYYFVNIFIPLFIGLSFFYLFIYIKKLSLNKITNTRVVKKIMVFGDLSYELYFSNFIGTWFFSWIVGKVLGIYKVSIDGTLLYFILLPFMLIITYYLAFPLQKINISLNRKISKLLS